MAYNNNIPQATDNLSQSQADLLANFAALDSQYGSSGDHVAFSAVSNNGKHKKSTYVVQGSDPGSSATEAVVYSKTSSGSSELFLQRDAVATAIQLTKGTVNIAGDATGTSKGHTFLPGGLLLQWGSLTAAVAGTAFTFDVAFTSIYAITCGIQAAASQATAFSGVSTAGATAYSGSGSQTINYIAIGI